MKLKTKIWLTIAAIVFMFSFFTLYYFPNQQAKLLLENYNTEVQNLANTVSLGVKIAITEQNFEGVQTAMEFVKDDPRLEFVSMVQTDTVWSATNTTYQIEEKLFKTYPEGNGFEKVEHSNDSVIIKRSPFQTAMMSGLIVMGFSTKAISEGKAQIRNTSLLVSAIVLLIGVVLGLWLAKTISGPVMALRDAAIKVGNGDLTQHVNIRTKDEIGELGKAFNKMVADLSITTARLTEVNDSLASANQTLNNTVQELKATQSQLIQSEKMASLGELTAGIAHEIQNPLNFINNFSEVNKELAEELEEELKKGNTDDALDLSSDIRQNAEKIVHHGKRADSIVKNMLQHFRQSSGNKEPTDLNALVDEYLRLSYHGLRAKDKSFNAAIKTSFDDTIAKANLVPQDIGRVLLNLFNNAFYSLMHKKKQAPAGFEPLLSVVTKRVPQGIQIIVRDNGMGIPQHILNKIYQPFFTTKPTGEGTGLGLSMSYDIVTNGHGGVLDARTEEGEYAEFEIILPA